METTKKWSKMLLAGMLAMVLTFGLVLAGCDFGGKDEDEDKPPSDVAEISAIFGKIVRTSVTGAKGTVDDPIIMSSSKVKNTITKVAAKDVTVLYNATFELFSNAGFLTAIGNDGLTLNEGDNYLYIKVTAENKTSTQYFKVRIERLNEEQSVQFSTATLNNVLGQSTANAVGTGTKLSPKTVTITVANTVTKVTLNDVVTSPSDSYKWIDSTSAFNGGSELPLGIGNTHAYIVITAEDGETRFYYDVTIIRLESGGIVLNPTTVSVAKGTTQQFTVTIDGSVSNSGSIVWTVENSLAGSTISGSGHGNSGGTSRQTRTLTVGAGETATTLTVRVTYGDKSATATVTVE
jgi:hypothetical protein